MGCVKCSQEKVIKESKKNEIINPYTRNQRIEFKPASIIDTLDNQIDYNNIYTRKEILLDDDLKQLDELIKKIRMNKRLLKLVKKFQSIIIGIQFRKKIRYDNLRRAETISLDALSKRDLPLQKYQIENFFKECPPKVSDPNLKIIKSEPILLQNKIIYVGEWDISFFQRYGRGIQFYPDGSYYKGYWENDKAEGNGEFVHSSGDKYVGNWHDNKRHGRGIYKSIDGKEYEGYWKNDKPNGEGKEIVENGNIYIGSFSEGLKNGIGRLQMKNGCLYEGNFEKGKMNGKGVYTFTDKRIYEGNFVNNTFEGQGKYTWPNGNKFIGYFKNNQREGFGVYYLKDGKKYRGVWSQGILEGEYDIYNPNKNKWIKKKAKEREKGKENLNNNVAKSVTNKVENEEKDEPDAFNNGQIIDLSGIDNQEEINKNENIEIEINLEDIF